MGKRNEDRLGSQDGRAQCGTLKDSKRRPRISRQVKEKDKSQIVCVVSKKRIKMQFMQWYAIPV